MTKQTTDWNKHKLDLMKELARLEEMNWAADEKVAQSISPYVLVEAINLLKNSTLVDNPIDYTNTGDKAKAMVKELVNYPKERSI